MIHLLVGENTFMRSRALDLLTTDFEGDVQAVEGADLLLRDLPDLLMATSLFNDHRLVIIKELSENSGLWGELPNWLEKVADTVDVVFVETKPDRRTQTYKELKRHGIVQEFVSWTDKDHVAADTWLEMEAKTLGLSLDKKSMQRILERVGMDQHRLSFAIEKLSLADEPVTPQLIDELIDAEPAANVFLLFETAYTGKTDQLRRQLDILKTSEDPYKVFGLLSSQLFQLAAVYNADPSDDPARDFGLHPYVVKKLQPLKRNLSRQKLQRIVDEFVDTDILMKTTSVDPWQAIEKALWNVAS